LQGKYTSAIDAERRVGIDPSREELPTHGKHRRIRRDGGINLLASATVIANKLGADHARPIGAGGVVENLIARGGAFVYQRHCLILSLRLRFVPGPFSFENWCYGVSWSGPRRGFTLGENALKPLAGNPPGMGRAEAIAPTARAAPDLHALLR